MGFVQVEGFSQAFAKPRDVGEELGMLCFERLEQLSQLEGPVALAIGVFDGLHLGHQEVIAAAAEHAHQHRGQAVVMTFEPHPLAVLRPELAPRRLCGPGHRLRLLRGLSVAGVLACPFTPELAATPAEDFVARLVGACQLGCISVGYTWTFGRGRGGNIHALMDLGQKHGFAVYGVPPVRVDGEVVSSTSIREAVGGGDLERAAHLLGRPYSLFGRVGEGRRLARELGFATANVMPEADQLPPFGVYAVRAEVGGVWRPGVANLGLRPTVETAAAAPLLETHLFDWSGDLYGGGLEVRLEAFLRSEQRFASVAELRQQIERDAEAARLRLG